MSNVKTHKNGIKLEPTSANPSGPTQGQLQYAGASHATLSEGLYRYDGSDWKAAGGGVGSMTYFKTFKANDDGTGAWTVYSVDSLLPDFDGSTPFGANEGDFAGSSTGDALFSNDSADKVYKFTAESASQYSAVGTNVNIPKYARGKDVGLSFFYRTKDTADTSADADWMVWVFDQTNGVQTTFNDTPGTFAAGTAITVVSTTGMAVGDKIWVEEASQVVETHITEVTSGTQLKLADSVTCGASDRFVTGVLTDVLTTIDAADSDTNEIGEKFQVTFLPPETCTQVTFMVQQLSSETDVELYFDGVVFDSSPFAKVSTQGKSENGHWYAAAGYGSTATKIPYYTNENFNTISKCGTVTNDSTDGWKFTAKQKCVVDASVSYGSTAGTFVGFSINGTVTTNVDSLSQANVRSYSQVDANIPDSIACSVILETGDILRPHTQGAALSDASEQHINITATPLTNEAHVVESTDSVVGEWTSYTPTFGAGLGTCTNIDFKYRRVGDSMEVSGWFTSGTVAGSLASISLPSGKQIDTSKISQNNTTSQEGTILGSSQGEGFANHSHHIIGAPATDASVVYFGSPDSGTSQLTAANGSSIYASSEDISVRFTVPIAGWDANPKPLLAFPTITYGQEPENLQLRTFAGRGSTNTAVPYYTNVDLDTISNLGSYVNDSTSGFIYTASARTLVAVSASGGSTTINNNLAIIKNGSELSTEVAIISNPSEAIAYSAQDAGAANAFISVSATAILEPGDTINIQDRIYTAANTGFWRVYLSAVPIQGVTNQAAIISQPVAFVEDRKPSGTSGGNSSTSGGNRDLNTLSGDIAAVGVTTNGTDNFTLPAGKYLIEWSSPFVASAYITTDLYNSTDSKQMAIAQNTYNNTTGTDATYSQGKTVVTITKSTSFNIRYDVGAGATDGLGLKNGTGGGALDNIPYELYTQVKITRLK